ncbi:MAG: molecular chaperone [Polaromonas sp.]|nr:molecular chaperone [Polaromonas sp.]
MLASGPALAQVLISPVVVEVGARQRVAAVTVTLSDKARVPMRLQAEILRWRQDVQGDSVTVPSDDLLVSPPIADLQPGDKQVFRVALRGPRPSPEELAYRLILENVAKPVAAAAASSPGMIIKFRMRYDLPVLVAPASPVVNALRWKPCEPNAASTRVKPVAPRTVDACLRMLNAGNHRVKVQTLTLAGDGWSQALTLKDGETLLAGTEREWRVPMAANQTRALRGVQVLTASGETLQAEAGAF